ncbi:MAG: nitroreductase family protein [Bacteroidales bacterium]|jgi:nitroreductase|nr:nitroreductase family protein [Bacteroidales bacterium]
MEKSEVLRQIIRERKSTRSFSSEIPPPEMLDRIIESCIYAPYGGATGIHLEEIRKIFVFTQGTESMTEAKELMLAQIRRNARKLGRLVKLLPFTKKKFGAFVNRLNGMSKNGIPSLNESPHFIVVAEKKGFPPVEKQSVAHAMENMWLTATAEGLGFQLISATGNMSDNLNFLKLLGLEEDKYHLEGCVIGYPKKVTEKNRSLDSNKFTKWM